MEKKIKVRYIGKRFPKIVSIKGGNKKSFQPGREVLVLDEYDALRLLKSNQRLTADKWAFTVDPHGAESEKIIAEATGPLHAEIAELKAKILDLEKQKEDAGPDPEKDSEKEPEKDPKKDNKEASDKKAKKAMST